MAVVYDDEKRQKDFDAAMERAEAKFMAWAEKNLIGKPVADLPVKQVKATFAGILKAELGELVGAHKRPVTTPRRRA